MSLNSESARVRAAEIQALESAITAGIEAIGGGRVTAFPVAEEDLAVAVEVDAELLGLLHLDSLAKLVEDAARREGGAAPRWIALLELGQLLPNADGDARRSDCARRLVQSSLGALAVYRDGVRQEDGAASSTQELVGETERQLAELWRAVLGVEPSRKVSFFALGGSSLLAAQLVTRVSERFRVMLDLRVLFEAPTLQRMALAIDAALAQPGAGQLLEPIATLSRAEPLPLSAQQARMRFLWQLDPEGAAYAVNGALQLSGAVDVAALQRALLALVSRQEALRTRFPELEGEPRQYIDPPAPPLVSWHDLRALSPAESETESRSLLLGAAMAPFDLSTGPLFRVSAIWVQADELLLGVSLHHSIADGTSMNVLVHDLVRLYSLESNGDSPALSPLPIQYADYAHWQAARLAGGEAERQLQYWLAQLGREHRLLELPSDRPRPATQSFRGARLAFELGDELVERARELARQLDTSLFTVLLSSFDTLLFHYTAQADQRVGVAMANRSRSEAEGLIGAFLTTQVLRVQLRPQEAFAELVRRVHAVVLGARAHQELPFESLVEALQPERDPSHNPLFQVMYNHQERDLSALRRLPGLSARVIDVDSPVTRFDLSLNTECDESGRLSASFSYATDLFDAARMERMASHWRSLLSALLAAPTQPIAALDWLPSEEKQRLAGWSVPPHLEVPEGLVADWIEARVRTQPDAPAVTFGETTLTYAELDRRAARLAARLSERGVGPDAVVGVAIPRSLELVVALVAIAKAGCAYLALDPEAPAQRLAYLIQDAGASWVLFSAGLDWSYLAAGVQLLEVQEELARATDPATLPRRAVCAEHLAYVLYTSGSTGEPKAVGNTWGALAERLSWMQQEYALQPGEPLLHKTPLNYDVAVWEVFWPLLAGAQLIVAAPGDHRDPDRMAALIQRHAVTTIHFVPSMLREFLALGGAGACTSLRRVFSGGEALTPELQHRAHACWPGVRLDNRYGPTEALINATYWTCRPSDAGAVPIGRPIPNTLIRILDAALNPAPMGVTGELYIGGAGLARGYLGRAALTAERFVPDPHATAPGQRLYRSGDFARFRADGAIEYLGRRDQQLKIRGTRIELGELERALEQLPGVRAAAARAWPGPNDGLRLVAYVVGDGTDTAGDETAATGTLQRLLEQRLPSQLCPSQIVVLSSLPLLPSGKLDRRSLPEPSWQARRYEAPSTPPELRLVPLWQEVLQVERVGASDDFFELGGHSLLATRLVSRVRRAFDIELPLRVLFEARTLRGFAASVEQVIAAGQRDRQPPVEIVERNQALSLSYSQERMWFLWSIEPESAAYNVGGAVELRGALEVDALEQALHALVARHEGLRATFPAQNGHPVQLIHEHVQVPFLRRDVSQLGLEGARLRVQAEAHAEAHRPFDLASGPLLRVVLLRLEPERHVLLVTLHHIAAEGWAMDIFAAEYAALYDAFRSGRPSPLAPLVVQYADYAAWQRSWLEAGEGARQLQYWKRALGTSHPVLDLPGDRPRPPVQSSSGDYYRFALGAELAEQVRLFGVQQGVTLMMTMSAALYTLLYRYTGQSDLRLGYPVANRIRQEFEGLIGAFLNTQVLRCEVDATLTGRELIERVKNAALEAQSHQDVPFHRIVEAVEPQRSAAHLPLFQVMINVQRWQFQQTREAAGLQLEFLPNDSRSAKCDLALDVSEVDQRLACSLTYSTDLFDRSTVERMAQHFENLLRALVAQPDVCIGELPLLAADERAQRLSVWNPPRTDRHDPRRLVHELLAERLSQRPDAIAVVCSAQRSSAAGLQAASARLAQRMQRHGVGPEVRVGVYLERSVAVVVAIQAVWQAGGAFVPLDVQYPAERISYMLEQAAVHVLITQRGLTPPPLPAGTVTVYVDDPSLDAELSEPPRVALAPENLAYILYTSGSTGQPKGVAVSHASLTMHLQEAGATYALGADDSALCLAAVGFDAFLEQAFVPLLAGARLILSGPEHWGAEALCALCLEERVTLIYPPTSRVVDLAVYARQRGIRLSIQRCCVGGEAVPREHLQLIREAFGCQVTNGYGPTETVITPLLWRTDDAGEFRAAYAPIGRAVGRRSIYVLDERLELVAPGVIGELYIGLGGLARGYFGLPGLTADRFVPDPFSVGGRLYRTGDLVRDRGDGNIEFIGRRDGQIKIRGFRVELGEIEAALVRHPSVEEAVVVLRESQGRRRLVGYVASSSAPAGLAEVLKAELRERLPDYMVPAQLVLLTVLPRTPNGKIDKQALPEPELRESGAPRAEPESPAERTLAGIWQRVLGLSELGLDDNFFELGGDSILSLQVVNRAREAGLELTPKDLFQHQTLRALAGIARRAGAATGEADVAVGDVALTPVQARFFAQDLPRRHHYNHSLELEPRRPLDGALLEQALGWLVTHHDALRLRYRRDERGEVSQRYVEAELEATESEADARLWQREVADPTALHELFEQAQRSLDLERGPLLRAVCAKLADGSQRLLLVIHHLVVDGVSWRILLEDLEAAYLALEAGRALLPPAKTSSYQRWAARLQAHAQSAELASELDYWLAQRAPSTDAARAGLPEPGRVRSREIVRVALSPAFTAELLRRAPQAFRSQVQELLLTALARASCRWADQSALLVELEGHGREELFDGVSVARTVGWFTSLFPVLLTPALGAEPAALSASIRAVQAQLRAVPSRGLGYGLLRELADDGVRAALAAVPPARVTFNYLGQLDQSFDSSSLFSLADGGAAASQDAETPLGNWLGVSAQVLRGQLDVSFAYSRELLGAEQVAALAEGFRAELEALVAHCLEPDVGGASPADFPLATLSQAELDALGVPARELEDVYPLSPLQQGLMFHALYHQDSAAYVNQLSVEVSGLDVERLRGAWQAVIARHEALRTGFVQVSGEPGLVQVVRRSAPMSVRELSAAEAPASAAALADLAEQERSQAFDLAHPPLQRVLLVPLGSGRHQLIWTHHHIILDGWSSARLLEEVLRLYRGETLAPKAGRYVRYIEWLQSRDSAASERFWRQELLVLEQPTSLAGVLPKGARKSGHAQLCAQWPLEQSEALQRFARRERITHSTLVQGAWILLLQRYTSQRHVAFGVTVAGRPAGLQGVEEMLGLFINTVPMIEGPAPAQDLCDWLRALSAHNVALREQEHTPLPDIQRWAGRAGQALFDTLIVFENYPMDRALRERGGAELRFGAVDTVERTNYALTLEVNANHGLSVTYKYATEHFEHRHIEALHRQLQHLLEEMSRTTSRRPLAQLSLLDAAERAAQQGWNDTAREQGPEQYVHQLIEEQAARQPDAVALACGEAVLTYGELNARANQLARWLRSVGVGPDIAVGVCLERSVEMVIALLAVLKAGGAYVPLDPSYPRERLAYMLEDSGVRCLLSRTALLERFPQEMLSWCVDRDAAQLEGFGRDNLPGVSRPGHLCYSIYTSGSTGRPKGVQLEHWGFTNYVRWAQRVYRMEELDGSAVHSSIGFDLTVTSLWVPLCTGKRVELTRDDDEPLAALANTLERGAPIGLLKLTPSHALALAEVLKRPLPGLRAWIVGGEALSWDCVEALNRIAPNARVVNEYGPTEAVVGCCVHEPDAVGERRSMESAPIGAPIDNTELYVVDTAFQRVPAGVAGELCIGGLSLARGYRARPGLTAERFVPDPFGAHPGRRLYRTGDLARYRADGTLEYLGRIDHQVKVRGYRIELGEIEARLLEHPGVAEAAVIARETATGKQLVGYVAAVSGATLADTDLRQHLSLSLPDYMVPARVLVLDRLPITANGKLDRKALPAPEQVRDSYEGPEAGAESVLAEILRTVLGVERVGRDDNFFELGGDSIVSLRVANQARHAGLQLSPKDIFEQQTVRALARAVASSGAQGGTSTTTAPDSAATQRLHDPLARLTAAQLRVLPVPVAALEDVYPLSPVQRGMLFHALLDPRAGMYVSQLSVAVEGLDVERFRAAWQATIEARPLLRTALMGEDEQGLPWQVVCRSAPVPVTELDRSGQPPSAAELAELAQQERLRGFDLTAPPLQRVLLVRLGAARHQLIWTHHHVLVDGWSNARLIEDVLGHYFTGQLSPRPGLYRHYIEWLESRPSGASEQFWKQQLSALNEATLLARTLVGPGQGEGHAQSSLRLDTARTQQLVRFAQRERVTLNTLVQAAWVLLLQRYTGQSCVAFGATVAGRPAELPDVEHLLGLFINTLPVIQEPRPSQRVGEWLRELQAHNALLREHEHSSLYDVQRWGGRKGQELFDTIVVFENYPMERVLASQASKGLRFELPESVNVTNYALGLFVLPGEQLTLSLAFSRREFDPEQVARIAAQLDHLLEALVESADIAIGNLGLATAAERAELARWNHSVRDDVPALHRSIEAQVERTPDAIAVVSGEHSASYAELNARANRLARGLRRLGVGPEVLVGLCLERSLELPLAVLAVLKAGGAYVPIDPELPADRIQFMIEDSGLSLVLSEQHLRQLLPATVPVVSIRELLHVTREEREQNLDLAVPSGQLAYCIYTSGSTGVPKAVENEHRGLAQRLCWMQGEYRLTAADRVLQKTPFGFDISVQELLWPLTAGARLGMAPPGAHRDPAELRDAIQQQGITVLDFVASMLRAFVDAGELEACSTLRLVTTGAEAVPAELARQFGERHRARLVNEYGPTEAAVAVTYWDCAACDGADITPIGRGIAGTTLHVLDRQLEPLPAGAQGELYIGGVSVARGYRRRPSLTAERFVPDPFAQESGQRLYRTGDLVRRRADGVLEFIGRIDQQVKIRGHRIELGEIEARLRAHPEVRAAAVVARDIGSSKQLVGYIVLNHVVLEHIVPSPSVPNPSVPHSAAEGTLESLRSHLRAALPEYMVPAQLMLLGELPVTANGKLDRRALPAPEVESGERYVEPRLEVERLLAKIWGEALGVHRVGLADNFFELGGDSILSLQVVSRARQAGLHITPKDVFQHQTIGELAQVVRADAGRESAAAHLRPQLPPIDRAVLDGLPVAASDLEDVYPLSPMQKGILFHALLANEGDADVYVNQVSVSVTGLDVERFRAAWQSALERHDALRMGFPTSTGSDTPLSVVWRKVTCPVRVVDLASSSITDSGAAGTPRAAALREHERSERTRPFELSAPPLWRVLLVQLDEQHHQLIWTYHHAVLDGWSGARLLEEVLGSYLGRQHAPPTVRYRHYIEWLAQQDLTSSERFWRERLAVLEQPTLLSSALTPPVRGQGYGRWQCALGQDATRRLERFAQLQRVTLNTLVQAAWALTLRRYTTQQTVCFGATVAGRPASLPGADLLLGLFINTLPVLVQPEPEQRVGAWLRDLQQHNVELREHEHSPLYDVQRWGGRPGQALFDSIVVFDNYPVDHTLRSRIHGELELEGASSVGLTSYPMTVNVEAGERLVLNYDYSAQSFPAQRVQAIAELMQLLLLELAGSADRKLRDLPTTTVAERARLLAWSTDSAGATPVERFEGGYIPLFEQRVAQHPERVAAACAGTSVSYRGLDREATQLSRALRAAGVKPGAVVGVLLERGLPLLGVILGVLKAGAGYVPLDPKHPVKRLAEVLAESRASVVVSAGAFDAALAGALEELGGSRPAVLQLEERASWKLAAGESSVRSFGQSLGYVIYTSGSTGVPKGAMVEQAGMLNNQLSKIPWLGLSEADAIAQTASQCFDISVWQLLTGLLCGARVEIVPDEIAQDASALLAHVERTGITILESVPSLMQAMLEVGAEPKALRAVLATGEALSPELARRWRKSYPKQELINAYGPAECSDDVSLHRIESEAELEGSYAPIGRATDNNRLYVLDEQLELAPIGVTGELYVAGTGVGRGYLNQPGKTAEVFLPNPFGGAGERLYRTGDLARYREDGVLECVGRTGQQVKIRGYRIELGEIEAKLLAHAAVREAVVVASEGALGKRLVAYVVTEAGSGDVADVLRAHLETVLPQYMVPSQIVTLDELPLTPNGKVDRSALPDPEWRQKEYVAPRTDLERDLARLFGEALGLPQVGISDDFFELGGDSIVSMQVVARARRSGLLLHPRDVFERPTVQELAQQLARSGAGAVPHVAAASAAAGGHVQTSAELQQLLAERDARGVSPADFPLAGLDQQQLDALGLPWREIEDVYPLSPLQEGLLVHTLLEPGTGIYLMQDDFRIDSPLDRGLLDRAWLALAGRHELLRTSFLSAAHGMLQVVWRKAVAPVEHFDWRALSAAEQQRSFDELTAAELRAGFDMSQAPLWRVRVFRLADASYRLLFSYHHILMDAWSNPVLLEDLFGAYVALGSGQATTSTKPTPYRQFIAWLGSRDRGVARGYWQSALSGFERATPLPMARATAAGSDPSRVGDVLISLSLEQSIRLRELAGAHRLTLNTFVQAAWALTLARYSGTSDVLFGVTVAGRPVELAGIEGTVGLFINSIPLRIRLPRPDTLTAQWLRGLLEQNFEMRQHDHLPLVEIQSCSDVARGEPLFHSLFVFENAPANAALTKSAEGMQAVLSNTRTHTNYPLTLIAYPNPELGLRISYDERCFGQLEIQSMLGEVRRLLNELALGYERPFEALDRLPAGQRGRLLQSWTQTQRAYPFEGGYIPLFEQRVAQHPERVAAACAGTSVSYRGLDREATQLSRALRAAGVRPGAVVGVLLERGLPLLGVILGVLKAGAGYVPLDPKHPVKRLAEVLGESRASVVVSAGAFEPALSGALEELGGSRPAVLKLEERASWKLAAGESSVRSFGQSLGYVIYTSGSTGVPKGAMVEQAGMLNNQLSKIPWLGLSEADAIAQTASQCFDISVWQLLTGLLCGARVEIVPDEIAQDAAALLAHVERTGITILESVPSLMQAMLEVGAEPRSLRAVLATGEALSPELARRWRKSYPKQELINAYGPAECSDDVSLHRIESEAELEGSYTPIGRATDNNRLYVLDEQLELAPIGVTGELYVAGTGVGRGYLNQPGKTAEVFLPNPFGGAGERLYRTGDLARYREDGVLECVGRTGQQVKIRGYRIELGEIEAKLLAHAAVREAVVVASEGALGKRLMAYVVTEAGSGDVADVLRAHLETVLPQYMVPSQIVTLDELPLTPNGKVDRRSLMGLQTEDPRRPYLEPQSAAERHLAAIWRQLFALEEIGRNDDFFELGGHSLTAMQVLARINAGASPGDGLPLSAIFRFPQLSALAAEMEQRGLVGVGSGAASAAAAAAIPRLPPGQPRPLSPLQERLWVVDRMGDASLRAAYNMGAALKLQGEFSYELAQAAFQVLLSRHEVLRTSYVQGAGGEPEVLVQESPALDFTLESLPDLAESDRAAKAQRALDEQLALPFNLAQAPLLRAKVLRFDAQDHVLVVVLHHIVADDWSIGLLVEEFCRVYAALRAGAEPGLAPLPLQYADYAAWQQRRVQEQAGRDVSFWQQRLAGISQEPPLATDFPREAARSQRADAVDFQLNEASVSQLDAFCQRHGVTRFVALLSVLQVLLHRVTGRRDLIVGTDVSGRHHRDLEGLVGFFVNVLPIRSQLEAGRNFATFLADTKQNVLDVLDHQELPFDRVVDAVGANRRFNSNPLIQVLFVFQNAPPARFDLDGVQVSVLPKAEDRAKFDLAIFVHQDERGLSGEWMYSSALFDAERIRGLMLAWLELLQRVQSEPERPVAELEVRKVEPRLRQGSKAAQLREFGRGTGPASKRGPEPAAVSMTGSGLPLVIERRQSDLDPVAWATAQRPLLEQSLYRHGGLLFRGFGIDSPAAFQAFAQALEPALHVGYGDLPPAKGAQKLYDATPYPNTQRILFHNEGSHLGQWPRKQLFYCERPAALGGATPIVDCRLMYRSLPPSLIEKLRSKGLRYIRTFSNALDVSWQDFFKTTERSVVEERCRAVGMKAHWFGTGDLQTYMWAPALLQHPVTSEWSFFNQVQLHHHSCLEPETRQRLLEIVGQERMPRHVSFGDGTPISDAEMALIGECYERLAVRFAWQAGDVVLVDNLSTAHARDAYEGDRKILVAMGLMMTRDVQTPEVPAQAPSLPDAIHSNAEELR